MNYPSGLKKVFKKPINHGNRGMNLENEINKSNEYYLNNMIAVIHKKPTPINVVRVDYKEGLIKEAFFQKPSTTDYNGIYKGKYIDFEAKETNSIKGFPLNNIHNHQIEHLKNITLMGGIGFLIVRFTTLNLTYLLDSSTLLEFINEENKKVIPLNYFKDRAFILKDGIYPRIDYLKIVDSFYFKGEKHEDIK
jgi:recombination protein U